MHHAMLALRRFSSSFVALMRILSLIALVGMCSACGLLAMDDERVGIDMQKIQVGKQASLIIPSDQLFYPGTANLKPKAFDMLESVAAFLNEHKVHAFSIEGYLDNGGSNELNKQISSKQAQVMMAYLWRHMDDIVWAKFEGKGSVDPIISSSKAIRAGQNRRLAISYQDPLADAAKVDFVA